VATIYTVATVYAVANIYAIAAVYAAAAVYVTAIDYAAATTYVITYATATIYAAANHTAILGSAGLPLAHNMMENDKLQKFSRGFEVEQKLCHVNVMDTELQLWKQVLRALAERCKTRTKRRNHAENAVVGKSLLALLAEAVRPPPAMVSVAGSRPRPGRRTASSPQHLMSRIVD
jgi:hypothetical protein